MPIRYMEETGAEAGECAVFDGLCAPEEADGLLEWLRAAPGRACDLAACGDLHTSLLQLLLAARVRLAAAPADPVLAACLAGLPAGLPGGLAASDEPDGTAQPPPARARRPRARASSEQRAES